MTPTTRLILRVYAMLLHFYPPAFRDEFADEMQTVFAALVSDAAQSGIITLLPVCVRELVDLARNSALERWRERQEGGAEMDTSSSSQDSPAKRLSWRETVLGLFPFALGMLLLITSYAATPAEWKVPAVYQLLMTSAYLVPCLVILAKGATKGFPRWSYPSIGAVLFALTILMSKPLQRCLPIRGSAEAQVLAAGLTLFVLFACILLAGRFWRPLAPLFRGVQNDWTLFSFGLYLAAALIASAVDHDDYPNLTLAAVAPSLVLFLGALAYLHSNSKTERALALLVAVVIAVAVRTLEGLPFYPAGIAILGTIAFIPALLEFVPPSRPAEPAALER